MSIMHCHLACRCLLSCWVCSYAHVSYVVALSIRLQVSALKAEGEKQRAALRAERTAREELTEQVTIHGERLDDTGRKLEGVTQRTKANEVGCVCCRVTRYAV